MTRTTRDDAGRVYKCDYCTKKFFRKGECGRHMAIHTGIRPYVCQVLGCGKGFAQRNGLKTHMNTHTGLKPFVCEWHGCTRAFADPSSCIRHRREIHEFPNAYSCPRCSKRTKRKPQFAKHLKESHGIEVSDDFLEHCLPKLLGGAVRTTRKGSRASKRQSAASSTTSVQTSIQLPSLPQYIDMTTTSCNDFSEPLHASPPIYYQELYDTHNDIPSFDAFAQASNDQIYQMDSPAGSQSPPSLTYSSSVSPSVSPSPSPPLEMAYHTSVPVPGSTYNFQGWLAGMDRACGTCTPEPGLPYCPPQSYAGYGADYYWEGMGINPAILQ